MSEWRLYFQIVDRRNHWWVFGRRSITFQAENDREACTIALRRIMATLGRTQHGVVVHSLTPAPERPGMPTPAERLFRLKERYQGRGLRRSRRALQAPHQYFVAGYGPEALRELEES